MPDGLGPDARRWLSTVKKTRGRASRAGHSQAGAWERDNLDFGDNFADTCMYKYVRKLVRSWSTNGTSELATPLFATALRCACGSRTGSSPTCTRDALFSLSR